MAKIKTPEEIKIIHEGGRLLAEVMAALLEDVQPGVAMNQLNAKADELMRSVGGKPSFFQYKPRFANTAFPAAICACLNEEIVHAFGTRDRELVNGDILSLDIGMEYKHLFSDMAVTVPVGAASKADRDLIHITSKALEAGIGTMRPGVSLSEIGRMIQKVVESARFCVVRDLVGHGVGHAVHEEPSVPNYYDPNLKDIRLEEGMVLALEPMVTAGSSEIKTLDDGWTVVTADGSRAAHFEHTVAVTRNGVKILTTI